MREPDSHNHGWHNDALGAAIETGWGGFLYAATIAVNIQFLPWKSGAFGRRITQAAAALQKFGSSTMVLFSFSYTWIATSLGYDKSEFGDPAVRENVWTSSFNCDIVRKTGQ